MCGKLLCSTHRMQLLLDFQILWANKKISSNRIHPSRTWYLTSMLQLNLSTIQLRTKSKSFNKCLQMSSSSGMKCSIKSTCWLSNSFSSYIVKTSSQLYLTSLNHTKAARVNWWVHVCKKSKKLTSNLKRSNSQTMKWNLKKKKRMELRNLPRVRSVVTRHHFNRKCRCSRQIKLASTFKLCKTRMKN